MLQRFSTGFVAGLQYPARQFGVQYLRHQRDAAAAAGSGLLFVSAAKATTYGSLLLVSGDQIAF